MLPEADTAFMRAWERMAALDTRPTGVLSQLSKLARCMTPPLQFSDSCFPKGMSDRDLSTTDWYFTFTPIF